MRTLQILLQSAACIHQRLFLSSKAYAYDNYGNNKSSDVTKKDESLFGVVYNVEDTYMAPSSAPPIMYTDNGKVYIHLVHLLAFRV